MEPIIIFAIVTAVVLAAIIVIDWKGRPFQLDKVIASWLAVFSFFGGVLDMSLLAIPGVLVVVWLALMGWRYQVQEYK